MRSHLFQGNNYYPSSGTDDYTASFNSPEEAVKYALDNPKWNWYAVLVDDGSKLYEHEFSYYRDE